MADDARMQALKELLLSYDVATLRRMAFPISTYIRRAAIDKFSPLQKHVVLKFIQDQRVGGCKPMWPSTFKGSLRVLHVLFKVDNLSAERSILGATMQSLKLKTYKFKRFLLM